MSFLKLNFTQKVWLGFAIIIFLLSMSSALSLFNLNDISGSTERVNEQAVPVQKQSNLVQISLLKQAKLSSSGFNAITKDDINTYIADYDKGRGTFDDQYAELKKIVEFNESMSSPVNSAEEFYTTYHQSVVEMFNAKLALLEAKEEAQKELNELSNMVDDAGAVLLDISYFESDKHAETIEVVAGVASRIDGQLIGLYNSLKQINAQEDLEAIGTANEDLGYAFSDMQTRIDYAAQLLEPIEEVQDMWKGFVESIAELKARTTQEKNIVYYKTLQLQQTVKAREQLNISEQNVKKVVEQFDQLLLAADEFFNTQQTEVMDSVSLGMRSVSIAWIILIALAWQNFNSMRQSIKKKMADLAKLNSTGEQLAATQDKNKALEDVLAAMHEQVGVGQGSVYLTNEEEKLELKAYYPPKNISPDSKPKVFGVGEGILGKAAESKKIIFVPNTHSDKAFVNEANKDAPPKALLCVPLVDKDVLIGVMNFSGDVKGVKFEDSDYEFAYSIARALVTTIKNIRMREVIEEQNRTLEQKVKERTAELRQKNKDIAIMMENLAQGVFTITEGGVIHPEFSAYLKEILETEQIANRHFMDVIFTNTTMGDDGLNQVANAVDAVLGMDEMMFEFNSHLMASELIKVMDDGREKILELDWAPIVNQNTDEIEKMLVTVRDVTELKALQREAEAQKQELEIIGQILAVDNSKFQSFITTSFDFIKQCRQLIQQTKEKDLDVVATLFRNMHTVKGNARTYGFNSVTDSVHRVEHSYDELRKDPDKPWEPDVLLEELAEAERDVEKYHNVAKEKLNISGDAGAAGDSIDREKVSALIESALQLDVSSLPVNIKKWVNNAYSVLISTQAKPVSGVLSNVVESVNSLSSELGKEQPEIVIDEQDIYIKKEAHDMLNNIFMHVFRNAIDHGIEKPEDRTAKGKSPKGRVDLKASHDYDKIHFEIKDDGKGLALGHIYRSAVEKGIFSEEGPKPSAHEIANLIFSSGFSTAEEVTEVSGRGVGMDAVKQFLQDNDGSIEIILEDGNDDDEFRAFTTHIKLSDKYLVKLPTSD